MTVAQPRTTLRCSVTARARGDELFATAAPARRFLLLEVPGPWLPEAMTAAGLGPDLAVTLRTSAAAAGVRILLIRRPGRHPAARDQLRRWAIAGRTHRADRPGSGPADPGPADPGGVRWGRWRTGADLLDLDLAAAPEPFDPSSQRPIALVCTHGRHDLCCAVEGRPVVAAAAADPAIDVWECSHLGGDRFAANLLWLPSGQLFGGLTAVSTGPVLAAARDGRVLLEHYRGRCGDPQPSQAAQWLLMRELAEDRPGRVVVERTDPEPPGPQGVPTASADVPIGSARDRAGPATRPGESVWIAAVRHGRRRYRVRLAAAWTAPEKLTCRATTSARVRAFRLLDPPARLE